MLAWVLARPIARGAPSDLDDSSDISIAGSAASKAARDAATAKMGSLESDPWSEAGDDLKEEAARILKSCLLYTSPSPRDQRGSRMPSSA